LRGAPGGSVVICTGMPWLSGVEGAVS